MSRPTLPAKGKGTPKQYRSFLDRVLQKDTAYRILRFKTWERARLYYQNDQWLEEDYTDDPTRTPFWRPIEVDPSNWIPMPVRNIHVAPIQNEVARLIGQGSRPYVRVEDDNPKSEKAAKLGKDVLLDRMEKLHWTDVEHEGCHQCVTYGTWVLKSYWDIDFTKTVKIPVTTGVKCPNCDFKLATPQVPEPAIRGKVVALQDRLDIRTKTDPNNTLVPPKFDVKATHCLNCQPAPAEPLMDGETGAPMMDGMGLPVMSEEQPVPPLAPYVPTDEEAQSAKDAFGRPLGDDVALGDTGLRNVPSWDYFPQNGGLQTSARKCEEHGEEHVESLEWIRAHYKNGDKVKAEDAETLLRWHPIVGGSDNYFGGMAANADPDLLSNHARVREFHKEPYLELVDGGGVKKNRGRSIVMAGDVLLLDDDYLIPCETTPDDFMPRVVYDSVPWELRDGELWGLSASELLFSIQDSINTRRSQVEDARHRFGSPKILAVDGMDLNYAGFSDTGYNSDIWYYRPVEGAAQLKPEPFGNVQMNGNWVEEENLDEEAAQRISGANDTEIGDPPAGVTAASALMYIGEKASERRKPRINRIIAMKRRIFTHQLQLIHEKYREKRYYHVRGKNDRWGVKSFMGTDLLHQTNVMVDEEPAYNVRQVQREAIKDALGAGTISADTAGAKREINKSWGVPTEVNEEQNRQVEIAQEEWLRYYEEGISPAVKVREDAHQIHYQTHLLDWMTEDAQKLRDEVDWNQIELTLWGWGEEYEAIEAMEADLKANPVLPQPPSVPLGPDGSEDPMAQQQSDQMWQQRQQMAQQIAAMPKPPELRMMLLWTKLLEGAGLIGQEPEGKDKTVGQLLRWKAHYETHWKIAKAEATAAVGGSPSPAPPGAPETPEGMTPGLPGRPTLPGPGAGQGATTAAGSAGMAA